jgi:hypothetical protein
MIDMAGVMALPMAVIATSPEMNPLQMVGMDVNEQKISSYRHSVILKYRIRTRCSSHEKLAAKAADMVVLKRMSVMR